MTNAEMYDFFQGTLIKIENAINFLDQESPKHILAYNKMLGVQQKILQIEQDDKICEEYKILFPSLSLSAKAVITYFINGRYPEAYQRILTLKKDLVLICIKLKNSQVPNS